MSHIGMGVHITPPQPIEEAIAWHTVPAQLSALRKMLRDAETSRYATSETATSNLNNVFLALTGQLEALQRQLSIGVDRIDARWSASMQAARAQFQTLEDRLSALDTTQRTLFDVAMEQLDSLDKAQQARLDKERVLTTQKLEALLKLVEGIDTVHAARNVLLSDRVHQLEQAPLKRFWRWLTRQERKNGSTL